MRVVGSASRYGIRVGEQVSAGGIEWEFPREVRSQNILGVTLSLAGHVPGAAETPDRERTRASGSATSAGEKGVIVPAAIDGQVRESSLAPQVSNRAQRSGECRD